MSKPTKPNEDHDFRFIKVNKNWIFSFQLYEIDIYPHPYAKSGWFIGLHPNKSMLWDKIRYESRRKSARALHKILLNHKKEIDQALKELEILFLF